MTLERRRKRERGQALEPGQAPGRAPAPAPATPAETDGSRESLSNRKLVQENASGGQNVTTAAPGERLPFSRSWSRTRSVQIQWRISARGTVRCLHENATILPCPQWWQTRCKQPRSRMPRRKNSSNFPDHELRQSAEFLGSLTQLWPMLCDELLLLSDHRLHPRSIGEGLGLDLR